MAVRAGALENLVMFNGAYRGSRVLVTGHTGFKGSWLCHWLQRLGAQVTGVALEPDGDLNLFSLLGLRERIDHRVADVRDAHAIQRIVAETRPAYVFHLAAQALVRLSYQEPKATFDVNVGGTVNLLEAVRSCPDVRSCVVVTSDKCYDNREWPWGYREIDPLGGKDPYSASKAAAELAVASWRHSFQGAAAARLSSVRAGNVIGGGDWAANRLVPDLVTAVASGQALDLRNPQATRPWQHVLEPLSGYLQLAERQARSDGAAYAEAWNFGPHDSAVISVRRLAELLLAAWGKGEIVDKPHAVPLHEAGALKLDSSKAMARLGWHCVWDVERTVERTISWYRAHQEGHDCIAATDRQLDDFTRAAGDHGLAWATRE